ncbi:alpha-ribazole phosphatase [Reichenbachiella agarivorans]|uniref:Alpha-ribazole phosphatase n=1 Tax=Reichenbachiella agarivorans TaxID=2979464 RepID=A0ABY6CKJ4_9BACT|nr:alpha-ribazole phosphatase [Reichenbachiella agarivorans]UXP31042.1 alpha-ribazole phosphatase [Reichenbachiella agarivorans]
MEIYLVRHTTPSIGKGICYGQSNLPLAKGYQKEMAVTMDLLPQKLDAVYTSPLVRCRTFAFELSENNIVDQRLLELNFGDWELIEWKNIAQNDLDHWMENYVDSAPPKGESYKALAERVLSFWNETIQTQHEQIAIVCHAGPIRALLAHVLNLDLQDSFKLVLDYGSVSRVDINQGHFSIKYINKT